jgi:hypothetical protein
MSKVSNKYVKSLTPIKDSILWNKTFPKIKDFPQKYKKEDIIPDNIDIKKIASEYFKNLVTIEDKCHEILSIEGNSYQTLSKQFLHYKKDKKFTDIDKTLSVVMGKHFDNLRPKVRLHTNVFCHLFTIIEKEFVNKHFFDYDINIIYWTILFHDIAKFKKMHPTKEKNHFFSSTDSMHPYKSAIIFIDTLLEKKLIEMSEDEKKVFDNKYSKFKKIIFDSFKNKSSGYYVDIKCFGDIIQFAKYIRSLGEKNDWLCDAFILIIFHQNLPNNEHHMNSELLTKDQIKDIFDLRLIEMMRIIMVLDSLSHQIFDPSEWTSQINKQLDKVRTYFTGESDNKNDKKDKSDKKTDSNKSNKNNGKSKSKKP